MKTTLKTAGRMLGLLACLLVPQTARCFYNPQTGRWLSRDPADQMGGANSYLFVRNNTLSHHDILGLWNADVHRDRTTEWAEQLGISSGTASAIGVADNDIDKLFDPKVISDFNFSWHFNRSTSGDSRLTHRDQMLRAAKKLCTASVDDAFQAAVFLGYGLHPLQDWVAHGDFNTKKKSALAYRRWSGHEVLLAQLRPEWTIVGWPT